MSCSDKIEINKNISHINQLGFYLRIVKKESKDRKDAEILYAAYVNLLMETNYDIIISIVKITLNKIKEPMGKNSLYLSRFLKFANFKIRHK